MQANIHRSDILWKKRLPFFPQNIYKCGWETLGSECNDRAKKLHKYLLKGCTFKWKMCLVWQCVFFLPRHSII